MLQGVFESSELNVWAGIDDEGDLFVNVYGKPEDYHVREAFSSRDELEWWRVNIDEDNWLVLRTWILDKPQDEVAMEFVLKVIELDSFMKFFTNLG